MKPTTVTLTREELYELVWNKPMTKIAAKYGLSDVALRKKCMKADIPTPRLGYWAKVAAGQKMRRARLPKPKSDIPATVMFEIWPEPKHVLEVSDEPAPDVPVPEKLQGLHAAVQSLREALKDDSVDRTRRYVSAHRKARKCDHAMRVIVGEGSGESAPLLGRKERPSVG